VFEAASRARIAVASSLLFAAAAMFPQNVPAAAAGNASFTAGQSAKGASAYRQNCAACHGAKLQGVSAPALSGKASPLAQQSVAEVYEYVSQQMPMTAPGSLTSAQYLNITAYILQENGHRPGAVPLTAAAVKTADVNVGAH
jgi:mono/diheme cytochrome c family protein